MVDDPLGESIEQAYDAWRTPDWYERAACKGRDTALWISSKGNPSIYAPAKKVCETCPVKTECLETALRVPWLVGVWGGTNASERERIRVSRNRAVTWAKETKTPTPEGVDACHEKGKLNVTPDTIPDPYAYLEGLA